mgnify:CR=1 FL=1
MPGDFPDVLSDVFATVHDFNSGDIIAFGRMNIRFIEHTDRLRVMRARFTGEFTPDSPEDKATLDRELMAGFSAGTVGHKLQVEHGGKIWTLTVKFEPGDAVFPFTGRQDPKVVT